MTMRKSNFELLRLICMFLVLVLHSNFLSIGAPVYSDTPKGEFFIRNLIEVVPFIAVNVFILISGFFSIRPNVKSIINLLFCCLFYSVGVRLVYYIICWSTDSQPQFGFWDSFLFISNSVWFVADYLMLMIFAPILNAFVEKVSNRALIITVGLMLFFAFYFGLIRGDLVEYISGFSFVTFILLYLIGRVLHQNKVWIENHIRPFFIWGGYIIGMLVFYALVSFVGIRGHVFYFYLDNLGTSRVFTYTNPFVILSAVCFFMLFMRKEFVSPKINKLAKSVFAILLIHSNHVAITYYNQYFRYMYEHVNFVQYLGIMLVSCVVVFALSILVDQIRILIYEKWISPFSARIEEKIKNKYEVI